MEMEPIQSEQRPNRPVFLTVLCILTFIATGISTITVLISAIKGPDSEEKIEQSVTAILSIANQVRESGLDGLAGFYEKLAHMTEYMNQSFYLMLGVNVVSVILGLGGALLMWKGRKIGFHSYILYNILGIVGIYFAVPVSEVPTIYVILQVIFSTAFIIMYSRNLHWLR